VGGGGGGGSPSGRDVRTVQMLFHSQGLSIYKTGIHHGLVPSTVCDV
jgi:hypothetical protein